MSTEPTTMTPAMRQFRNGALGEALALVTEALRLEPGDTRQRAFCAELLCLNGELERADRQLETLRHLAPDLTPTVGVWRRVIRAAQIRDDVYRRGAVPTTVAGPTRRIARQLEALTALREGDGAAAADLCRLAESERSAQAASVNGETADDCRDLDDLSAGIVEVLGADGRYYWIDFDELRSLTMRPPARPLDLLWRPGTLRLHDGTGGDVFVPVTYPLTGGSDALRLGRRTDWLDDAGPTVGLGRREWLVGDTAVPLSAVARIERPGVEQDRRHAG